jgi:acetylornithine deacetylase/succinyl-diaminopimelate desuccinylase-like protein
MATSVPGYALTVCVMPQPVAPCWGAAGSLASRFAAAGHYDVQPAAEPDWSTNPFELNSVNEYMYGRGVSDNKVSGRARSVLVR